MKFYSLFDLIDYKRQEYGHTEKEMYDFFRKRKVKKSDIVFYKDSCAISQSKKLMSAVVEYTGMSKLEVYLAMGIVPEEYKSDFFDNIHEISKLLEVKNSTNETEDVRMDTFFETSLGKLYNADCLKVLATIEDESVDTVFADPPFNLKKVYDEGINDSLSTTQYIEWCYKWIEECIRILKPGGSLFIYNIPKWTIVFSEFLNKRMTLRSWIAVDMKFSLPISGRLYPAHYGLLYYVKGEKPNTFNNQRIPLMTCRHCGGEIKDYGGYKNKMNPKGVNVSDVWTDIYPVRHKSQKKIGSELGNCKIISDRFANIEKYNAIFAKVCEEKNVLFTENVKELRKRNGFWLSEDFGDVLMTSVRITSRKSLPKNARKKRSMQKRLVS